MQRAMTGLVGGVVGVALMLSVQAQDFDEVATLKADKAMLQREVNQLREQVKMQQEQITVLQAKIEALRGGATTRPAATGKIKHSVVFVSDRSGSMRVSSSSGNLLVGLNKELVRVVEAMDESYEFHIIFFSAGEPLEFTPKKLVPATAENKRKASDFIERVVGTGKTDVLPALKRAQAVLRLAAGDARVCLLTDGDYPDNDAVVRFIKTNLGNTRVDTFLLGSSGGPSIRETMQDIATITHGEFRPVEDTDKPGWLSPAAASQPASQPASSPSR